MSVVGFFDTASKPTGATRTAPVGDDVYGRDPSVNELEAPQASTPSALRFVLHHQIRDGDVAHLAAALREIVRAEVAA